MFKKTKTAIKNERYVINGKEYSSIEQIPEDERQQLESTLSLLEDKDGNGIADVFDNLGKGAKHTTKTTKNEFSYTVEGDRAAGLEQIMKRLKDKAGTSRTESAFMAGKPSAGFVSPLALEQEREREREQARRKTARNVVLGIVLGFLAAIVLSRLGYL
ncbi:MAG: hypothetical protein A2X56_06220 [Nitrospirae bacterium GWC2_57_13]|jgi:hypothetical protein|nr:MAG: hypothetical protein A2X56_06220 [Nitrospirae bacterium GWC2_57_13]HAS52730.1 hypothetical protein [Nitrospiraceae bacterium]